MENSQGGHNEVLNTIDTYIASTETSDNTNYTIQSTNNAINEFINSIILTIKAFDGDIYGSAIRDFKLLESNNISNINCRLDTIYLTVFNQTLYLMYEVRELPSIINGFVPFSKRYQLSPKSRMNNQTDINFYITLDVANITRYEWQRLPCDLDVNLLAENRISRFIRSEYHIMNRYIDKFQHVCDRIKQKQFCLLDSGNNRVPETVRKLIDKVSLMILDGWTMDDSIHGDYSWIVASWITLLVRPGACRTRYSKEKIDRMLQHNECMLCNEQFQHCDIIINTRCNHNFHWGTFHVGGSSRCKGLVEWVKRDKLTCPCCRSSMF
jgi:hypothetical protein